MEKYKNMKSKNRIIRMIAMSRLYEWPYPQMRLLTDKNIDEFIRGVGYEGIRERSDEIDSIKSSNSSFMVGQFMAAVVFGYIIGYLIYLACAAYVIYFFITAGGK